MYTVYYHNGINSAESGRFGPFADRREAERACAELAKRPEVSSATIYEDEDEDVNEDE